MKRFFSFGIKYGPYLIYPLSHIMPCIWLMFNTTIRKILAQIYLPQFKVVKGKREAYSWGYHKVTGNLLVFLSAVKWIGLSGPRQEESNLVS